MKNVLSSQMGNGFFSQMNGLSSQLGEGLSSRMENGLSFQAWWGWGSFSRPGVKGVQIPDRQRAHFTGREWVPF